MKSKILNKYIKKKKKQLNEYEAKKVLKEYQIPTTKEKLATTLSEARKYAEEIGPPIVLKIVSPDILHKTDAHLVEVNLSLEEIEKSFKEIMKRAKKYKSKVRIEGILVQQMVNKRREIVIGVIKDPQFGHAIMFGLGGIFVEVLNDVSFRIIPLDKEDAKELITEVKGYPILKGLRGEKPVDINSLIDIIIKTSKLVQENPEIQELDMNPILVDEEGAVVVDTLISVS